MLQYAWLWPDCTINVVKPRSQAPGLDVNFVLHSEYIEIIEKSISM